MKLTFFMLGFLVLVTKGNTQALVSQEIPTNGATQLSLNLEYGDVEILQGTGTAIQIKGTVLINNGMHDDAYKIEHENSNGELLIKASIPQIDELPKTISVVKDGKKYSFFKNGKDDKSVYQRIKDELGEDGFSMFTEGVDTDIKLQIFIPRNLKIDVQSTYGDVSLKNLANPLKVDNTYGFVEAQFENLSGNERIDLRSKYAFVDVAVPANASLEVNLDSDYGRIYTDFDLAINKEKSKTKNFSNRIVAVINQGGPLLKVEATYKNIYFRQIL